MNSRTRAFISCIALLTVLLASWAVSFSAKAVADDTVTTTQLIDDMKKYDGEVVSIQGEAVGDLLLRGHFAWITVNDDRYSNRSIEEGGELVGMSNSGIGIWVSADDGRRVAVYGGYKYKGSIVRVTGVFHRACEQHGGDTDIHADSVEVVTMGYPFSRPFKWLELLTIIILSCAALVLWRLLRTRLKKEHAEE